MSESQNIEWKQSWHDDKLTIWNEGLLPDGMELESLKRHHISRPRNPLIADVCFKAGYIDSWGRGTLKILVKRQVYQNLK
jgi:predicted HTH transcriptional regulator